MVKSNKIKKVIDLYNKQYKLYNLYIKEFHNSYIIYLYHQK
jgi:hypothetical protein